MIENIERSDLDLTPKQLGWLHDRLDELHELLESRGELHIQALKREKYSDSLHVKGGTGYTQRFLGKDWSVYRNNHCVHPIPELQDRVLLLSDTTQALSENQ